MQVAGEVLRIGHPGDLNEFMCVAALSGAEMAMRDAGVPGSGVAAAQALYPGEQPVCVEQRPRQVA